MAPYVVFSDVTLLEMAEFKPANRWEMLKIRGVGNQKFKNYGEKFLQLINKYLDTDSRGDRRQYYGMFEDDLRIKALKTRLKLEMDNDKLKEILYDIFSK